MDPATEWRPARRASLPDYYALLGLGPDASYREVGAAYWRRAGEKPGLLHRLNEAYEVLGNAERRQAYDVERVRATSAESPCPDDQGNAGLDAPGVREKLNWFLR